jgi:hypothetical protein
MSDLQIGLAMLGVLIVVAVLAFNWWQERQFRQRGEAAFAGRHDDVLLTQPGAPAPPRQHALDEPRIEPSMEPRMEPHLESVPEALALGQKRGVVDLPRPQIDYIVELRSGEFIAAGKLAMLQQSLPGLTRRISFGGLNYQSQSWEALREDGR